LVLCLLFTALVTAQVVEREYVNPLVFSNPIQERQLRAASLSSEISKRDHHIHLRRSFQLHYIDGECDGCMHRLLLTDVRTSWKQGANGCSDVFRIRQPCLTSRGGGPSDSGDPL
jgi:hypothetical protein